MPETPRTFWLTTLGCPKNQVDSEKLAGTLLADGLEPASAPDAADLVVVNTCAFVEDARQESVDTILELADVRRDGAQLVVTGCLAERAGAELAEAMPEIDLVAGFGALVDPVSAGSAATSSAVPVALGPTRGRARVPDFDLLNLPRPPVTVPWAYVKVAEGCDRACGFCAIPSFRGKQRSRSLEAVLDEIESLAVPEVVLVAQDLVSYGRDQGEGSLLLEPLVRAATAHLQRLRLLYLYPSGLTDGLIDAICETGVPYFDLSLQHVSRPLLRRMRRPGHADAFLDRMSLIRTREPDAAFRSNFIVGYPGETEEDHDALLAFVEEAQLDWCGFFSFSPEPGTYAAGLDGAVDDSLVADRLAELRELQDEITARRRDDLVGSRVEVLVDTPGSGRSHREAPEIDGAIAIPDDLAPGTVHELVVTAAYGPDLEASLP